MVSTLSKSFNLERESHTFADELSGLLNGTICYGVRLTSVVTAGRDRSRSVIGYRITKDNQDLETCIPVTLGSDPTFHLGFSMRLERDHENKFLMVRQSVMLLSPTADPSDALLHYDYERDKRDGYPDAHLQICATSETWQDVGQRLDGSTRLLERMHLPVGGRRFRPTLEDIVEFLVTEHLVEARPSWRDAVDCGRESFRKKQLRAAIRRDPDTARDALAKIDADS